jgi:hypothetical protein
VTTKTLKDVMPDIMTGGFVDTAAFKLRDEQVASEHGSVTADDLRWPGKERNVYSWVILTNGKAVGWNENSSRGWSYPVITLSPQLVKAYQDYSAKAKENSEIEQ